MARTFDQLHAYNIEIIKYTLAKKKTTKSREFYIFQDRNNKWQPGCRHLSL